MRKISRRNQLRKLKMLTFLERDGKMVVNGGIGLFWIVQFLQIEWGDR
jgi:hypothetical protein